MYKPYNPENSLQERNEWYVQRLFYSSFVHNQQNVVYWLSVDVQPITLNIDLEQKCLPSHFIVGQEFRNDLLKSF